MVKATNRPRTLLVLLALAGAVACSSRFRLERAERSKENDQCAPTVAADPISAPVVPAEPLAPSAGVDAANLTTPSPALPSEHDCAHGLIADTSGSAASSGPSDGSNTSDNSSARDVSLTQVAGSPGGADAGEPFVMPPKVPTPGPPSRADVKYAVMISVDGLASRFLEQVIDAGNAPTFKALQSLAAWTHNARTDKTYTITLPNHTSMLTGLPVSPSPGFEDFRAHRWTNNWDPLPAETLHALRLPERDYTPSVFDVVHDRGRSTALFASKTKFSLYSQTYNDAGGPDLVGEDNGRRKIDTVVINTDPAAMVDALVATLSTTPANYTFVHLNQPDGTGHSIGWGTPEYLAAVANMDVLLGLILTTIQTTALAGKTALIITTDHGGVGWGHSDSADVQNFQIPFYVMAPGVPPGDAYAAFGNRFSPDPTNPEYRSVYQPLRNGDSGNLALYLLGLPPIPESVIHSAGIRIKR
jgi:hypothetical protein